MATYRVCGGRVAELGGVAILLMALVLAGCKRQGGGDGNAGSTAAPAGAPGAAANSPVDRLDQSFTEATVPYVPADQIKPADTTLAGKSVGKLYVQAIQMWDQVKFRTPDGRAISYQANLETEMGTIEIALQPEVAPNHVRNFIVLARIGYYDGLVFERIYHDQSYTSPDEKVELIEGGCPVGTGQPGLGSIGYWLKPEISETLKHEEGTVGACLGGETPDTAACRFYIMLSKAPVMDGERTIFGKVTRGIDLVRRILTQPISNTPDYPDGSRPENPIVIRSVTIVAKEASNATAQKDKK